MLVIADYGMGNLHSVSKGLQKVGADIKISSQPKDLLEASHVVLPGVGAFDDAELCLEKSGMAEAVLKAVEKGVPVLGICLGMQLMFEESEEGTRKGLGIFKEKIRLFDSSLKVPHMGWNTVQPNPKCALYNGMDEFFAYFVHSYYAPYSETTAASKTEYGVTIASSVWKDNVFATQFHPEKSGAMGLQILKNFSRIK